MAPNVNWTPLKEWFLNEKRDLPWRSNCSPYHVWISEIMLQQTQVSVVIPYYERWMRQFPSIQHLANASIDEVIKAWEGLGYYSRARNLHQAAKYVMEVHGGDLPRNKDELVKIKGLGPYTIGAIQSFAFHMKSAAVDGNVVRVLSRYFYIEDDISKGKTIAGMRELLEEVLPDEEPWVISEALIELGATICQKKPRCGVCPLASSCKARLNGVAEQLPVKSAKVIYEKLYRTAIVIGCDGHYLVRRGEKGKIMSDLYEFPYIEQSEKVKDRFNFRLDFVKEFPKVSHSFTRFRVELIPQCYSAKNMYPVEGHQWLSLSELRKLAFSSGHRRVFSLVCLE